MKGCYGSRRHPLGTHQDEVKAKDTVSITVCFCYNKYIVVTAGLYECAVNCHGGRELVAAGALFKEHLTRQSPWTSRRESS